MILYSTEFLEAVYIIYLHCSSIWQLQTRLTCLFEAPFSKHSKRHRDYIHVRDREILIDKAELSETDKNIPLTVSLLSVIN